MIEGLKLDFSTAELDAHLATRVSYHNERVAFYRKQVDQLAEGRAEGQQYTNGDPVRSLSDSMATHKNRAALLEIMRTHLIPSEVYRLDEGDLVKLELISGRMY
jgi:hypothetical protein